MRRIVHLFAIIIIIGIALIWAVQPSAAGGIEDHSAAVTAMGNKKWDKAIELFSKAIESGDLHDYHLVRAYTRLGHIYLVGKNDQDLALDWYNRAIELNPDYARAYFERAGVWAKKDEWQKAADDARTATKLEPKVKEYQKMLEVILQMAR